MDTNIDRQSAIIIKAFDILDHQIELSNKDDLEKEALRLLISKIKLFYLKKVKLIKSNDTNRLFNLQSYITDVIVDINNSLLDGVQTFEYIDKINLKLRDSEISHLVNKHKLLSYKLG